MNRLDIPPGAPGAIAELRRTDTIRERAGRLLARARAGDSSWFTVHDDALDGAAAAVADVTRTNYPDLAIPYHSRWRHFAAGGVDRRADLDAALADRDTAARARAMIDLTVISVLLDAGAGPDWRYREGTRTFTRSEGLAVASFHAFMAGAFSSDPADPLRVDAAGLRALDTARLAAALQVDDDNPVVGLDGRIDLLHRLGDVLGRSGDRPGAMFDVLSATPVRAHDILSYLLVSLSGIWPASNSIDGVPLGDCWPHPAVQWLPLHKLSQWVTYSLLEPFAWSGVEVTGLDELTGLPEYRNGGLMLDTGVLRLRDPQWADRTWTPADELIVEWRGLTVALLDELAGRVCAHLGTDLPLACVLEGGTWATGRALAQQLRDGLPPLTIRSDGTVF
ncbi:MAG: DUF1688 family protein [Mycobacterium sp.]